MGLDKTYVSRVFREDVSEHYEKNQACEGDEILRIVSGEEVQSHR